VKFSALNVDSSSPSPDPLGSRRPAHTGTPLKSGYFSAVVLSNVKMVQDRHRHVLIISSGDELFRNVNIDGLE